MKWETGNPAPVTSGKCVAQAVVLNGAVYVGGGGSKDDPHYRIDIYHPTVNKWSGTIVCPLRLFAITVHQGELAIAGGSTKNGLITNLVLVFNTVMSMVSIPLHQINLLSDIPVLHKALYYSYVISSSRDHQSLWLGFVSWQL